MTIARGILDVVVAAAEKKNARKILKVNMVVGELRGIVPLQLTFCFGLLAEDTIANGAELVIETTPIKGECQECKETFVVEDYCYQCPKCGSLNVQTIGGTELRVKDIEVE